MNCYYYLMELERFKDFLNFVDVKPCPNWIIARIKTHGTARRGRLYGRHPKWSSLTFTDHRNQRNMNVFNSVFAL